MPQETEFVTDKQWENYAKRVEKRNLKERGSSLTFSSLARRANHLIVSHDTGREGVIVKKGWRDAMAREPKYGYSHEHDQILSMCIANFGSCPFGCTKTGAPNCYTNAIINRECAPSQQYYQI